MKLTLTVPAQADFSRVANNSAVEGVRLNTTISLKNPLEEIVAQLEQASNKTADYRRTGKITSYSVRILKDGEVHMFNFDNNPELNMALVGSTERKLGIRMPQRNNHGTRPGMEISLDKLPSGYGFYYLNSSSLQEIKKYTPDDANNDLLENILLSAKQKVPTKKVHVDLKCRQLRIVDYVIDIMDDREIHYITLSRKIKLNTPSELWIDDGNYTGSIASVINGNTIVIPSSVKKKIGLTLPKKGEVGIRPGMSVNITDPSLVIEGYLTEKDKAYISAAKSLGIHTYMLSYVESESDIEDLLALDPDAKIVAKIESKRGLDFVKNSFAKYKDRVTLMAARGDMYVELDRPDSIIDGCEEIIKADPEAYIASRLFESFSDVNKMPKSQDIFDVYCGMLMGYKHFMIGDDICRNEQSVQSATGLFKVLAQKYEKLHGNLRPKPRGLELLFGCRRGGGK